MPSGPEGYVLEPTYGREFSHAKELLLQHPGRWRIVYHYDGDGIASASSAVRMFRRLGYAFQATPLQGVERGRMESILRATRGPVLIVDTGCSWLDLYRDHKHPVVVLDHHQYPGVPQPPELPRHVALVNPLDWGVDGMSEMCAATLTWLFTVWIDPKNWDNAAWGLSGAIADRQHQNGFKGLNARLLDEAIDRSLVQRARRLSLFGPTILDALSRSIDPFVVGLSGRPHAARELLRSLGIDAGRPPAQLDAEETRRLTTTLLMRLVQQGTRPEFVELLTQEGYRIPSLGLDAQEVSNYQNATGRVGEPGVGVGIALGDPSALERARAAEEQWRTGVLGGLLRVEEKGVNLLRSIQWFDSGEPTLAGTQAGLAMSYFLDSRRPTFAFTRSEDQYKISGRGTLWLVGQGLDLSEACRTAAQKAGGEGGGHKVASGATIPATARETFLDEVDRVVGTQLPIPSGAGR